MAEIYSKEDLKCLGSVGENVQIDKTVIFISPEKIHIGNNVRIDAFCILVGTLGIEIGDYIHIASYCQLSASGGKITMHDFSGLSSRVSIFTASDDYVDGYLTNPTVPNPFKKLKIGDVTLYKHVIVGCGAIIMPGIQLGGGSSVGALAFVNKKVDAYMVVAGNPAKPIAVRNKDRLRDIEKEFHTYLKAHNTK